MDLLELTLDSIGALDPAPAEVVVVSDGSTDGTDDLVKARGLRLLRTDRQGPGGARNAGWRSTDSDVIAFVDDDCVVSPSWLGALTRPFADDSVGLSQGRTVPAGPTGRYDRTISVLPEALLFESCNIAYRRSALTDVDGFDETTFRRLSGRMLGAGRAAHFGEDTDLGWRVRRKGWKTAYAPDAVACHHVFPGTLADALREEWRSGNFAFLVRVVPELRSNLPGGRYFLSRQGPLAQTALVGLVATAVGARAGALLALPYLAWLFGTRHRNPRVDVVLRDAVRSASLIVGSARARRLVL